ncbi:NAD(P)-dependent oxidoreductase [Achromobacter pulmonis]|jgi:NAD(P)H dehydrogenase (quinone)|uniref:NAD(P)-dependent oxidoreductase n=1 Tax=Achromobacter pulmonis TaxID=1389932 RepID=A0A2N8KBN1_9BURK|nr:NAD(P)-dependent oxidoreductase [Achromobacter pulmonis]
MIIAITGASGHLGRLVVPRLRAALPTTDIVALARSPEKAADLGVAVRAADYDKPDTLDAALAGADTLLLISSSDIGRRVEQHTNVIAAAKGAGVKRIVYTSLLHADTSSLSLATEHVATEAALKDSGLVHTVLRNGWYSENHTASIPATLQAGFFAGSAGDGRISAATRADFADAAVAVLAGEGHDGKVYELAGDAPYTLSELAAELSRQVGREIPYRNLPPAEYAALLREAGISDAYAEAIAQFDVDASTGALFDDGRELSRLIGRPTTPLADAVAEALANG